MSKENKPARAGPRKGGRALARYRVVQALYAWRQGGMEPWDESGMADMLDNDNEPGGDSKYVELLLANLSANLPTLQQQMQDSLDRRPEDALDPVEYSIILLGLCELMYSKDIPLAVIIDEAVQIAKLLAGVDSYKYVNAFLNSAATEIRAGQDPHK